MERIARPMNSFMVSDSTLVCLLTPTNPNTSAHSRPVAMVASCPIQRTTSTFLLFRPIASSPLQRNADTWQRRSPRVYRSLHESSAQRCGSDTQTSTTKTSARCWGKSGRHSHPPRRKRELTPHHLRLFVYPSRILLSHHPFIVHCYSVWRVMLRGEREGGGDNSDAPHFYYHHHHHRHRPSLIQPFEMLTVLLRNVVYQIL
jgi:hypothetical protein